MLLSDEQFSSQHAERIAALESYRILDTAPEAGFDDIVLLATRICGTAVALVSLVAEDRQWFKARIGFPACETPLSQSVCAHALDRKDVLVIPDLTLDERTKSNTLVTGEPHIRFYAGAPLETPEGIALGTLCVIDTKPRPEGLTAVQTESLQALARQVMSQMELRRVASESGLLRHELGHRLKNILSIVQAIVWQTLRSTEDIVHAREALSNRIFALAKAQEVLLSGAAENMDLATIVESAARVHDGEAEGRFHLQGPTIKVGPKAALSLTLMIHELATNATKYGALSKPDGAVNIDWAVDAHSDEPQFSLVWRESGGPEVAPPTRRGFGSKLIERGLATQVRGAVALEFFEAGLECRLSAPLAGLYETN